MDVRSPARTLSLGGATIPETIRFAGAAALPTFAKGVLIRRDPVLGALQRFGIEDRAVAYLGVLRQRHETDLLQLAVPTRPQVLVLSWRAARRILANAPEPFSPATAEKRAALAHFEPHGSLISAGEDRQARRHFSDMALESGAKTHSLAPLMGPIVAEEMRGVLSTGEQPLTWPAFRAGWYRLVRRLVLGDSAADDSELIALLDALRRRGNWAFLRGRDRRKGDAFRTRLLQHLGHSDPSSIAGHIHSHVDWRAEPIDQVTQWLFAFDAVAITVFRALAALLSDHALLDRARSDAAQTDRLLFLRNCFGESLRLWPTTAAILRETTAELVFDGGLTLPAHSSLILYVPFLNRDPQAVSDPHRFIPDRGEAAGVESAFLSFSAGPGTCPAHHLAPMLGSFGLCQLLPAMAELPRTERLALEHLPATLDHSRLCFALRSVAHG